MKIQVTPFKPSEDTTYDASYKVREGDVVTFKVANLEAERKPTTVICGTVKINSL
jgi:hypothetical protein